MNLYLTKPGRLARRDNTLLFKIFDLPDEYAHSEEECPLPEDEALAGRHALPVEIIDAVYLFGETRINTKLLTFLGQKRVPLHVFNYWGHHAGTFLPHAEQLSGELVIEQGQAQRDPGRRLTICRAIADAKLHNVLSVVGYYRRRLGALEETDSRIRALKERLPTLASHEEVMGIEGMAARHYYQAWPQWLAAAGTKFRRTYHPPDNPVNAVLSFLNSMLYAACVSELYRTALYPGISYLHAPQTRRFSLALDLVEPFKPVLVDRLVFRLFNREGLSDVDFEPHSNGVLLKDDARRNILKLWDTQLRTTLDYAPLNRSVSYRQLLRLDCYKLIKHLLEDADYTPYRMEY